MKGWIQINSRWWTLSVLLGIVSVGFALWLHWSHRPAVTVISEQIEPLSGVSVKKLAGNRERILRQHIAQILENGPDIHPQERINLLRDCPDDLAEDECEVLFGELSQAPSAGTDSGSYAEYFHQICLLLLRHPNIYVRFAGVLVGVASDRKREEVVRDYAVQHLREVWALLPDQPLVRARIVENFRSFVTDEPMIAGSSLLSLHLLGTECRAPGDDRAPAISNDELMILIQAVLGKYSSESEIRATMAALRIIDDRQLFQFRDALRKIVGDDSSHVIVRMSSISVIGNFGNSTDRNLLRAIETTDPRIIGAVRGALEKL